MDLYKSKYAKLHEMVIQTLLGPGWPGFLRCRWTFPDGVTSGVLLDALRPFTLGVLSSFSRICKTQIIGQISIVPNRERICLIFPEKTWIPSTVASIFQDSWSQEPTNAGMIQVCLFFFLTSAAQVWEWTELRDASETAQSAFDVPRLQRPYGGLWDHSGSI